MAQQTFGFSCGKHPSISAPAFLVPLSCCVLSYWLQRFSDLRLVSSVCLLVDLPKSWRLSVSLLWAPATPYLSPNYGALLFIDSGHNCKDRSVNLREDWWELQIGSTEDSQCFLSHPQLLIDLSALGSGMGPGTLMRFNACLLNEKMKEWREMPRKLFVGPLCNSCCSCSFSWNQNFINIQLTQNQTSLIRPDHIKLYGQGFETVLCSGGCESVSCS